MQRVTRGIFQKAEAALAALLNNIVLLNVVIAIVLVGSFYLWRHVVHLRNQRKEDTLYRAARDAYNRAAKLRDADASEYDPSYAEAVAALHAQETFDLDPNSYVGGTKGMDASEKLELCLTPLQIYRIDRLSNDPPWMRMKATIEHDIDHCVDDGTIGR